MSNVNPAGAGWEPDPAGRHQLRYWDGTAWTEHVSDDGNAGTDAAGRPAPGTLPPPPGATPAFGAPPPAFGAPPPYGAPQGQPIGYGYAPAVAPRPLKGLATGLTVLLIVTAISAIAVSVALYNRASILDDPFGATFDELQDADDAAGGASAFLLLSLLATGVVWIVWQHRHAKNARLLGQVGGLSPGWAIGGWFIPIAGWILPQLQLKQAAEASDPTGARQAPPVLILWWVLWVLGGIAASATNNGADEINNLDDIESFRSSDQLASASMWLVIAAAVAAVILVRALSERQHQSLAARGMPV